jgi:hypothetical protein
MKKADKKPTRAKREADSTPQTYRCQCGAVSFSKYAAKAHREVCSGR